MLHVLTHSCPTRRSSDLPDLTGFRLLQTSGRGIEIFEGIYIAGRRIPCFQWACLLVFGAGNLTAAGELDHAHDLAILPVWLDGPKIVLTQAAHALGSRLRTLFPPTRRVRPKHQNTA